jgi:hypothetical protein
VARSRPAFYAHGMRIAGTLLAVLIVSVASSAAAQSPAIVALADAEAELAALSVDRAAGHPDVVRARAIADARRAAITMSPDVVTSYEACNEITRRIEAVRAELAAQSTRYGSQHATVRRLRARMAAFERVLATLDPCPC